MKNRILLSVFVLAIILMTSCYDPYYYDYQNAEASFYTNETNYGIGEEVQFYNTSNDAVSFFWDFGDGETSTNINPSHIYTEAGTYEIKLNAYGRDGKDEFYSVLTIDDQTPYTKLNLLVMYFGTEDIVKNCAVDLYDSQSNWASLLNPVFNGETGINGEMEFTDVDPIVYWVDAYKKVTDTSYYSNEKYKVITNKLEEGVTNYYDVFVEFIYSTPTKQRVEVKKIMKSSPEIRAAYKHEE